MTFFFFFTIGVQLLYNVIFFCCTTVWISYAVLCLVAQLCLTLCDPRTVWPARLHASVDGDSPCKNKKWVAMPSSRGSSWLGSQTRDLLHCRWLLSQLNYQGCPWIISMYVYIYIYIYIYIYLLTLEPSPLISQPSRSWQSTELSSLCYTAASHSWAHGLNLPLITFLYSWLWRHSSDLSKSDFLYFKSVYSFTNSG